MHFVYIIYSKSRDKFYTGESSNLEKRIEWHNDKQINTGVTKTASDWEYKLKFECQDKSDALFLEKFIKRMKSRKFINKIIQNPEILKDILIKRRQI